MKDAVLRARCTRTLFQKVQRHAKDFGISVSDVVLKAVEDYMIANADAEQFVLKRRPPSKGDSPPSSK